MSVSVFASIRSASLVTVPMTEVLAESYYVSCSHVLTFARWVWKGLFFLVLSITQGAQQRRPWVRPSLPPVTGPGGRWPGRAQAVPALGHFSPHPPQSRQLLQACVPRSSSPEPAGSVGRGPGGQAEQSTVGTGTCRNQDGSRTGSATRRAGDPGEV